MHPATPAPSVRAGTMRDGTWPASAGQVSPLFWILAPMGMLCGIGAQCGWWAIDSAPVLLAAIGVMLVGGLPHGACDLALAGAALTMGWRDMARVCVLYVAVAGVMTALWWLAPVVALVLFLALATLHFGEDWTMLPPGLLRIMAGLAVIATAALGQPGPVTALFAAMTGSPLAQPIALWAAAAAPVTWLVTLVGLMLAWQAGHRVWVAAQVLSYGCLLALPPLIGFGVFFVGLHAPLHWRHVFHRLPQRRLSPAVWQGAALTALVLAVWIGVLWGCGLTARVWHAPVLIGGTAFCLLSIVAAPHLALSLAIERHVQRPRR